MDSWKRLMGCVKNDFNDVKKDFITFCISYSLVTLVYYIVVNLLQKPMLTEPLFIIPLFISACIFGITILCIQYTFQRKYTEHIKVPANINKLSTVILKTIQIYIIQFLLFMLVMIIAVLIVMIPIALIKPQVTTNSIFIPIYTFFIIVISIVWFYRFYFISNVIMYARIDSKNKALIQESMYLVKKNISVIITMIIISAIVMIPQIYHAFKNGNQMNINYVSSILYIFIGIANIFFNIILTVDEIRNHKYMFLLEPKKES